MQPLDEGPLIRPCAEFLVGSSIEALQERVAVNGQDEDRVEEVDEGRVVARATTEERGLYALVGYYWVCPYWRRREWAVAKCVR